MPHAARPQEHECTTTSRGALPPIASCACARAGRRDASDGRPACPGVVNININIILMMMTSGRPQR
eukprot:scaffold1994_cov318-Prasinococcus_capsulatus_cf.AAC.1